jgi:hypothetical protein
MLVASIFTLFAVAFNQARATPAPGNDKNLQERAVPAACANPRPVSLAYDVLSLLRANAFCTQWLGISTTTVSSKSKDPSEPPTLVLTSIATQSLVVTTSVTVLTTSTPIVSSCGGFYSACTCIVLAMANHMVAIGHGDIHDCNFRNYDATKHYDGCSW